MTWRSAKKTWGWEHATGVLWDQPSVSRRFFFTKFIAYGFFAEECVQEKQIRSVGGRPTGAKVRSPLAWVAPAEDNETGEAGRQSHQKGW